MSVHVGDCSSLALWRRSKPQPNQDATFFSQAVTVFCIATSRPARCANSRLRCQLLADQNRPFFLANFPRGRVTSRPTLGTLTILPLPLSHSRTLHIGPRVHQARNLAVESAFARRRMHRVQSPFEPKSGTSDGPRLIIPCAGLFSEAKTHRRAYKVHGHCAPAHLAMLLM